MDVVGIVVVVAVVDAVVVVVVVVVCDVVAVLFVLPVSLLLLRTLAPRPSNDVPRCTSNMERSRK